MGLFPASDRVSLLTNEILSWAGFIDSLEKRDLKLFKRSLDKCQAYALTAGTMAESFPAELLLMSLILAQQRIIEDLKLELA